jgi:DUF4097 and DUF4098 domain-containing protein YvlB
MMRRSLIPFCASLLAVAAVAPESRAQLVRQRLDTTFAFANGVVEVRSVSGPITVTTWNRKEVKIAAFIERGEIATELSSSRVFLEAKSTRGRMGDHEFTLTVPVGTRVDLRAVSGDISVKGTKAEVGAESVSGDVEVEEAEGRIDLTSVSGDVSADRLDGNVQAESVSGDVRLRDVQGSVTAEAVSGSLVVEGRVSSLRLETVSGDIAY